MKPKTKDVNRSGSILLSRQPLRSRRATLTMGFGAIAGFALLVTTLAAAGYARATISAGTLSGRATLVSDSSGGTAVEFGTGQATKVPVLTPMTTLQPTPAPTPAKSVAPTPTPPPTPTPETGYETSNWAGYEATGGKYTNVSGSWVVPDPTSPSSETTYDSAWVGIGDADSDIIQAGSDDWVSNGKVTSEAWYELLPAGSVWVPSIAIQPGDTMHVSIQETATNSWTFTITDMTNGESYVKQVSYDSSMSTVEWIEEDAEPAIGTNALDPIDDYGSVAFAGCTAVNNGATQNIAYTAAAPITMVNIAGRPEATPSALIDGGGGFSVIEDEANISSGGAGGRNRPR